MMKSPELVSHFNSIQLKPLLRFLPHFSATRNKTYEWLAETAHNGFASWAKEGDCVFNMKTQVKAESKLWHARNETFWHYSDPWLIFRTSSREL